MKKKSITSNYIYNLIYQIVVVLIPLLTIPYLTRVLGSTELGIYSYTYSIATVFFLFAALGINTYGQREIAYVQDDIGKRSKVFYELFIIRTIATIFSTLMLLILSFLVSKYSLYYQIFTIYIIANMFDITWLYQGMENFKNVAIRSVIVKIIYVISIFILVRNQNDIYIYVLLYSITTLITNLSFWINIKKVVKPINIEFVDIKKHIKPVLTFFIPQVAVLIYAVLDKTMLGIMITKMDNVYFYEQASYIDKTILMLITAIGTVMVSKISYLFQKKDMRKIKEYMNSVINFVWLLGSALSFGVCSIIANFVPWYYGGDCLPIINLVYVMSPIIILIGLTNVIGIQYLIPTKQQNKYIIAVVCGAIINVMLNVVLISTFGAIGAAISSIIAEFSILLIELYYVRSIITFMDVMKPSFKYILFGTITFIITYSFGSLLGPTVYSTIIQIVIGFIVYVVLLLISKDKFLYNNVFGYLKNKKADDVKQL